MNLRMIHRGSTLLLGLMLWLAGGSGVSAQSIPPRINASSAAVRQAALWADLKQFWGESMQLPGIDTGPANSDKRMLVYFDPNCPMCARQWRILKPYLNTLRIHWIPFAYFNASSVRMAAGLLAAKDPSAAFDFNENHYNFQTQTGGFLAPQNVPAWAISEVKSITTNPFVKQNIQATPTIGLELEQGQRYYVILGVIDAQRLAKIMPLLSRAPMGTTPTH
ncbi:MAG: hypothetical protein J0I24_15650 [Thiomonas arsenitoxydans]|uniref:Thioredoxin-like fold domain-containing protein n=1 Tax=Thiomonas arsenitoxydans (strain DSM 22701 / CIP 110005 / 3As) TaxID=426114 RepID=A0A8I1N0K9_THIA3|nr:hypothetical protein [Thiomonas arsenitoxydans]MBN8745708.1 hypothetical protein [Thiomonas arsenitoxydans]ODU55479.1 MAG: hypothetical protein ABT04_00775 [Granulicella sp. SCN 62-9]